jgi:plasmid stabilization system protein ParE
MTPRRRARYILAPTAQEDLVAIRDYYLNEAGFRMARQMLAEFVNAFRTIARHPGIGHRREDLAESRPVLFWPMRDYLIVYRFGTHPVEIVMIAHGSRDVARVISRRQL